jgi:hypothetical protein
MTNGAPFGGSSITLSDGTSVAVTAGSGVAQIPLTSEPAARASGYRRLDGISVPCRLMQVPASAVYMGPGVTFTLPDGTTTTAVSAAGFVAIPNEFVPFFADLLGFRAVL